MAGTRFAYVRDYELPDPLLPNTFLVVRIDGHAFHRFSEAHSYQKPNDIRGLSLMNESARSVMEAYPDISLAFGESDEYSFLLRKSCSLFNRRHSKILTSITSHFTSVFVFHWSKHFPDATLSYPPSFDGRIIMYPSEKEVRDYFSWRQADTHINNLYNTTFWALVLRGGLSVADAHKRLKGTYAKDKNEILFTEFGINYNKEEAMYRKGSVLVREPIDSVAALPEDSVSHHTTTDPVLTAKPSDSNEIVMNISVSTPRDNDLALTSSEVAPSESNSAAGSSAALDSHSVVAEDTADQQEDKKPQATPKKKSKNARKGLNIVNASTIRTFHEDIIGDAFWETRPYLLV